MWPIALGGLDLSERVIGHRGDFVEGIWPTVGKQMIGYARTLFALLAACILITGCKKKVEPPSPPDGPAGKPPEPTPPQLKKDTNGMVTISAGEFLMGCDRTQSQGCGGKQMSLHKAKVVRFAIDITEVTVEAYRECVQDGGCTKVNVAVDPGCNYYPPERKLHPMNCVNLDQAEKYCRWKGKRLPTEAEWEKAARGTDGRKYPWGSEKATCQHAVMKESSDGCKRGTTWAVGKKRKGASPYGVLDMAGNVWEWTQTRRGSKSQKQVVRGGGGDTDSDSLPTFSRNEVDPAQHEVYMGFRCALNL